MPPPLPPPLQTLTDIVTDGAQMMGELYKQSAPLIAAGYAFSQVIGQLCLTMDEEGPPPTYYINCPDPSSPTPPGVKAYNTEPYTEVATINLDQAAGFPLAGTGFGILMGPGMNGVALAVGSSSNGSPVTSGNPTILVGPGQLPLAGVGSSTATGAPIVGGWNEGVHMAAPKSHNAHGVHTLYTVAGTAAHWSQGFPAECGQKVNKGLYYWQPVDYPAATFPMGSSVRKGIDELVRLIATTPGTFAFCGYSQGALVTSKVWRDRILDPNGDLHDRFGDIFAHVTFGNPMRCPGIANGNGLVNTPVPGPLQGYVTGGVGGPDDLTPWQTPTWMMDFAYEGDMHAAAPVGADPWHNPSPVGEVETSIYNILMEKFVGQDTIVPEVGKLLTNPVPTTIAIIQALVNTIGFFGANQEPHTRYGICVDKAVEFLNQRAAGVPA
jgi:hypothetical protein